MAKSSLSWHEDSRGVILEGPYWRLKYDLLLGLFDLTAPTFPSFQIRWARARALYYKGDRLLTTGTDDGRIQAREVLPVEDAHGAGLRLDVQSSSERQPTLNFSATVYQDSPLVILELALHNTLPQPITVEALQPLEIDPDWGGRVLLGSPIAGLYSAGWQSWSPAGWKPAHARDVRTHLGFLNGPMHEAPTIRPLLPGRFHADLVAMLTPAGDGPSLLAGLLSSADQFGALQAHLAGKRPAITFSCSTDGLPLAPEERLASERVALLVASMQADPLAIYGDALGLEMEGRVQAAAPRGWCSWPAFGAAVSEQDVLRQLTWLTERRATLPVGMVQVDDGWEQAVGDWEPNERFPHGMKWLAEEIRQAGFTPGLWLAPFIVAPRCDLAREHPEWLLRDERGRPVSAGNGPSGFCQGLDLTRIEVQNHLRQLLATMTEDWGYSYLKLDFLYAAALPAQRSRAGVTRAQALRRGLEVIRQAVGPEVYLLGCGCPLGPAIGLVDGMRVGPDVAPNWKPALGPISPLVRSDPSFPATVNTVRNTLTRAWTHRHLWLNDPDSLILRRAGNRMSEAEVRTMVTVAAFSGGAWVLGDDLPALEEERQPLAAVGLPAHADQPRVPDLLEREMPAQLVLEHERPWGHGWAVALFNWSDRPADLALDLSTLGLSANTVCHLHEFWSGEHRRLRGVAQFRSVEAHGCRTFLLRPVEEGPHWVGSSLHIIQGTEVHSWEKEPSGVSLTLAAGRALAGYALLWLPARKKATPAVQGVERIERLAENLWRAHVRTEGPELCHIVVRL